MSLHTVILAKIKKILNELARNQNISLDIDQITKLTLENTKDRTHGDMATNAAMVLCQTFKLAPKILAESIVSHLKNDTDFTEVCVAGPGFINMRLAPNLWYMELRNILKQQKKYGISHCGMGKTINVEFVSANPTGPMHTGHGRNAVLGDVIANILKKVGYTVTKEYYINDAGGQIIVLAQSVYLRYREICGHTIESSQFEGKYPGHYIIPIAQALYDTYQDQFLHQDESHWLILFQEFAVTQMMQLIKQDLERLGIVMDIYTSEKQIVNDKLIEEVLELLTKQGDIYIGSLEKPKGHEGTSDWEERPQTLFRATKYGDDSDRALKKSDDSWTYFAGDLAYHLHKLRRGYDQLLNIFGCDHIGYIKRLKAAVFALSGKSDILDIKASQLVNFLDNGQPVRMSKRAGNFITIADVVERVGRDATRFMMISRHQDVMIDFDFQKVIEQSKDNPIFYIQYAHARICSVLRHANKKIDDPDMITASLDTLDDTHEFDMLKILCDFPRQIDMAAHTLEPHRICTYLYDVASCFHSLWNAGKTNMTLRFLDPDNTERTQARLALLSGVATVLQSGLELLGITAVEEMH